MQHPTDRIDNTMTFVILVMEHWLENSLRTKVFFKCFND